MHDTVTGTHWHEPKAGENAGFGKFKRAAMPYDRFMESEGIPVYRSIGARRMQGELNWKKSVEQLLRAYGAAVA